MNRTVLLFTAPSFLLVRIALLFYFVGFSNAVFSQRQREITLTPRNEGAMTELIQNAINTCAADGGGVVYLLEGLFLSGSLELKSNVTLHLKKGALLKGSDNVKDYRNDAFIFGKDILNVNIQGEGVIDGVNCVNPNGEEGFRGPHGIKLVNCRNIKIEGITIKNAANWAINCRHCSGAEIKNVSIRGGHDGLHTRFCDDFNVTGCDFRTGDDAFAGNDNRGFVITNCKVNTSCNGFRMGCYNLTVKDCKFWGPGEYIHKIQKRNNMLAAFVHFSPKDEASQLNSSKWRIENITIDHVDHVYMYNYIDGLWQTGKPVGSVQFKNVNATNILSAFNVIGDSLKQFNLTVKNSTFSFRNGAIDAGNTFEGWNTEALNFFYVRNFKKILLHNVTLNYSGNTSTLKAIDGNGLLLKDVRFNLNCFKPYTIERVKSVIKRDIRICIPNQ